jgi:hypothetical protein
MLRVVYVAGEHRLALKYVEFSAAIGIRWIVSIGGMQSIRQSVQNGQFLRPLAQDALDLLVALHVTLNCPVGLKRKCEHEWQTSALKNSFRPENGLTVVGDVSCLAGKACGFSVCDAATLVC